MNTFLEKLRTGRKVTIVAFGDSITELTWHTRGHLSWSGYLQEALFENYGRNRCWVINSGRCGDTAVGGLSRLAEDVLRFEPDLVIISYGMNDAGGDIDEFRSAVCELIDRIRAHNGADVLLRTANPVVNPLTARLLKDGQQIGVETAGSQVREFAKATVEIAESKQCVVVDHYAEWKKLEQLRDTLPEEPNHLWLYMSDSVHPGPLGHLAFFRQLAPYFDVPRCFPWEPADA